MSGSSIMETLFQRTVEDLIKGLRQSLIGETLFISKAMEEIRREIKSTDLDTKSIALHKLSYLSSLHFHDMSFAAFHVVELLSSPKFAHKRVSYLAASQSFHDSTSVLVLATNQLRKDLSSNNEFEVSLALQCLARIGTLDLARDLSPEVFTLLGSSKVSVKKRALAVSLRVFEKYPDAARVCFRRLVECLDCSDAGVLSAAVGVFLELAARDPSSYLPLAPEFFRVFVDCKNNWVLIKLLKIFALLAPLEPRLARRVVDPVCDLMKRSGAKSVVFECVRTVVASLGGFEPAVRLAVDKVREFLSEDDPNLKYLALSALFVVAVDHPWAVAENKEVVIGSLSDADPNVKLESLRLVMSMVNDSNVGEISKVLLGHAAKSDPSFCNEVLRSILETCGRNVYEIVVDFDWYVSVLGEISRVPHCRHGEEIERQFVDIGARVRDARPELVRVGRDLLIDPALLGNLDLHRTLSAAAWASGEYVEFSRNQLELVEALVQPRTSLLPASIRAVYLHSVFKVLVFCLSSRFSDDDLLTDFGEQSSASQSSFADSLLNRIESAVGLLMGTHDVEVLERARNLLYFIELIKQGNYPSKEIVEILDESFSDELGPVPVTAQERVPLPDGLKLIENLDELDSFLSEIQPPLLNSFAREETFGGQTIDKKEEELETLNESTSLLAEHRKRHGLYYLPSEKNGTSTNEYPPANEAEPAFKADEFVKLTEESLAPKKRTSHAKPRPMVVKLDGDVATSLVKPQPKEGDSLSEAVREALLGGDTKLDSSQSKSLKGKEKLSEDTQESKEGLGDPSSRKSKSQKRNENGGEAKKSGHRHSKRKSRRRTDVVPQAPVIPDFLL